MKIVLTGSSGRVGRSIYNAIANHHEIVGVDRTPFSTTSLLADINDSSLLRAALQGADAVIHTAALHAPHVGVIADAEFHRVNVEATRNLARLAGEAGVGRLVFTSTTALYGQAVEAGNCAWLDEDSQPRPRTIYHRTKLDAEQALAGFASPAFEVRVLRMARSFPEPADQMAIYRLHRGVDIRDVADAHLLALDNRGDPFQVFVVSAATPFLMEDRSALASDAPSVIRLRAPDVAAAFEKRGWRLPKTIDRVYFSGKARRLLGFTPKYGFAEVLAQLDNGSMETLPCRPSSDTL
jgi:nucleoside-diphosphate-sugar epimerase